MKGPLLLLILDGFGLGQDYIGNAITKAKTPYLDRLWSRAETCLTLGASGPDVGLPLGITGNSEVGHLNLGAATIVYQTISNINNSIIDGSFFQNEQILNAIRTVKQNHSTLHLIGCLSPMGIHSDIRHLFAIMEFCHREKIVPVIHLITDGRDTPRFKAEMYLNILRNRMQMYNFDKIGSVGGRFWGMDRNNKWERIELGYNAIIGNGKIRARTPEEAIREAYKRNEDDESLTPTTIVDAAGNALYPVSNKDTIFFFNFREDRLRQLTKAFVTPEAEFKYFKKNITISNFYIMSGHEEHANVKSCFMPQNITSTVSSLVAQHNLTQYHSAETEKYAHVTFFFNGGREEALENEFFYLVESPNVLNYAITPKMSIEAVNKNAIESIIKNEYDFYLINYANPDMIGHTGNFEATITAVETVDTAVGEIVNVVLEKNGSVIITSDHGNCERMIDPITNEVDKNHTLNLVPFIYTSNRVIFDDTKWNKPLERMTYNIEKHQKNGILADVGATVLTILGVPLADDMLGKNLVN